MFDALDNCGDEGYNTGSSYMMAGYVIYSNTLGQACTVKCVHMLLQSLHALFEQIK